MLKVQGKAMLNNIIKKGKHSLDDKVAIVISNDAKSAEDRSVQEIMYILRMKGKVLHLSLVSDKKVMYERIVDEYVTGILATITESKDIGNLELNEQERLLLSKELSKFVNNLSYVCYDKLDFGDIRVLLRTKQYDKIVVTASRFDRSLKFKMARLSKDFKINVQMNLYPRRSLL